VTAQPSTGPNPQDAPSAAENSQSFIDESRQSLTQTFMPKLRASVAAVDDTSLWWRANEHSNSIGNLVLHLAGNIRQWIVSGVGGSPDVRDRPAEFSRREPIPHGELMARLESAVSDADAVLARLKPEDLGTSRHIQGNDVTVLSAVYHVVEHFSMHTGQIILLAKMLSLGELSFYEESGGIVRPTWPGAAP
jgi:uncharacterized damage-inducible protein DinB